MSKSVTSESPLSGASELSGRYEFVCSPFTSGKQETTTSTAAAADWKAMVDFGEDDIYGVASYDAKMISRSSTSREASRPPMLQPVHHGSVIRREAPPLAGFSPLHHDRKVTANSSGVNTGTNGSSLLGEDNKSVVSACSRHSEADSKSERHRRYSQALQTPLTDAGSPTTSFGRAGRQLGIRGSTSSPVTDAQSARTENGRGSSWLTAPSTTNVAATAAAASARRPSCGRLEPLHRGTSGADAGSASDVVTAATAGRIRTPMDTRRAPSSQLSAVTSAPTYLPSGPSNGGPSSASFLREPLHRSSLLANSPSNNNSSVGGEHDDDAGLFDRCNTDVVAAGSTATRAAGLHRDGTSSQDSAMVRQRSVSLLPSGPSRPSHPVLTLPDKGSRPDGLDPSVASSPTPTTPQNARNGASRSGSGVFPMHTLVTRSKNVDNFDYGLSALGFPVDGAKAQPTQQHQPRQGSITPSTPGGNHSGMGGSFLVATSDLARVDRGGGSGLLHLETSPNDAAAVAVTTPSTLPSLQLYRQSGVQYHQSSGASAVMGVASTPNHSTASLSGNSAQQQPLAPLTRPASGEGYDGRSRSTSTGATAIAPKRLQGRSPTGSTNSSPAGTARVAPPLNSGGSSNTPAPVPSLDTAKNSAGSGHTRHPAEARAGAKAPPRPPPFTIPQHDPTQLKSTDYTSQLCISGSTSLRSLEETRPCLGMAYDEVPVPASFASNAGTLPSSNGSSGALASVSLRSTVLQPRCLPHNLYDVYDQRGESSNDFFVAPKRNGGDSSGNSHRSSSVAGATGSQLSHAQPSPGVGTPDKLSPKVHGRRSGPPGSSFDAAAGEKEWDALMAPSLPPHSDDDDNDDVDFLLYDSDSDSADEDDSYNSNRTNISKTDGRYAGREQAIKGAVQGLQSPVRCISGEVATGAAGITTNPQTTKSGERHSSLSPRNGASQERPTPRGSCETFLPFDEATAMGSRGFNSLVLTSFLRHAGSSESAWTATSSGVVWSPHPVASISSSPPSSMAATVAGIPYGGSVSTSASSQASMTGMVVRGGSASHNAAAVISEETPLSSAKRSYEGAAAAAQLRSGSAPAASPASALRVPAPPRTLAKTPRERIALVADNSSGITNAAKLPPELTRSGILRWAKPLSVSHVTAVEGDSAAAAASSSPPTGEQLLRQLKLLNQGAWQDVKGLSILEHRSPTPTSATRVFAVDNSYTIRVVQNDLVGDCETDECVERCAATAVQPQVAARKEDSGPSISGRLPTPMALPSVLMDSAIQRFFGEGENAIALVMDTAVNFATEPGDGAAASTTPPAALSPSDGSRGVADRMMATTAARGRGVENKEDEIKSGWRSSVVYATCHKVVEAFLLFKESQSKTQPDVVTDLKVAVALVPVLTSTGASTATNAPLSPLEDSSNKVVFYDAISKASSSQDICRPLEVATSPIFGTCLNGCQWLVVEDESDINAAFVLLSSLYSELQGRQGFLYVQFLHQCFIPGTAAASAGTSGNHDNTTVPASRGVAGFAWRGKEARAGGVRVDQLTGAQRNDTASCLSDIVVSSFTIASTRFPQVFELILDQRAGTPWPLLRYALGKGPSTVLGVVRVHEEDEEAAYPLSLLQRMRALQHPRPRRGSVRTFVAEQRSKVADLKRRLAEVEDRLTHANTTTTSRATMKRLSVLISKLECSAKDAEEFLFDAESNHVPVYVDTHRPPTRVASGRHHNNRRTTQQAQQQPISPSLSHTTRTPSAPERASALLRPSLVVGTSEPLLLAMLQHYDSSTETITEPAACTEQKGTARWTLAVGNDMDQQQQHQQQQQQLSMPVPRTLTAWLTLTKSVSFEVDEVTSLNVLKEPAAHVPACETWRLVGARFHAGCNATAVVVQEKQEESRLWSLRVALELVHGVLKDTWSPPPMLAAAAGKRGSGDGAFSTTTATITDRASSSFSSTPPSHEVMRVAVSVYHVSGSAVADLLRNSSTSRVTTGKAAAGPIVFTPATLAVRPLTGAAVPLNVTSHGVESLSQLEAVLREGVERLRASQSAVRGNNASGGDVSADGTTADALTRRCLMAPGYTVTTVELTQRVMPPSGTGGSKNMSCHGSASCGPGSGDDDVYVSSLCVINLGGNFNLLRDATEAGAWLEKATATTAAGNGNGPATSLTVSASAPSAAAILLARLLVRRRDLVVCAAALPSVPTAASAYGLLSTLKEFQQSAACAPHIHNITPPGSVRRLIAHLQSITAQADSQRGSDSNSLSNVRNALHRAQAVLSDPCKASFVSYPYMQSDADALMELPAVSQVMVDNSLLPRISSPTQHTGCYSTYNNIASSTITTTGTVSTIGGSSSSPEVSTVPEGLMEKSTGMLPHPPPHDINGAGRYNAERQARSDEHSPAKSGSEAGGVKAATSPAVAPRRTSAPRGDVVGAAAAAVQTDYRSFRSTNAVVSTNESASYGSPRSGTAVNGLRVGYYGVHYSEHDAALTRRDVLRHVAHQKVRFPLSTTRDITSASTQKWTAASTADDEEEEEEDEEEPEAVLMPSVLVLNASTIGAYVKRHGKRVRVPLPSFTGTQFASYTANEVVNIKPTSTGMKSSLLMRVVSCVSRGRTAALLISDTESCDASSCIAWLTLRTVMGGIFQSLKTKEVEGVQHCAVLRAFLIEENRENEFADLLAPRLTAKQPRHLLTRLKHSPFCGPLPADAASRQVRDLQEVNIALGSILAAAQLAHQSTTTTAPTTPTDTANAGFPSEPLRGAIALQLTFHQFIPATADQPADVVVSSLWCVQMGCSAGWMEVVHSAPTSATGTLLQYWMGGPCYTTSVVGLSRFTGVRVSAWKDLLGAQRLLRDVPLRLPRSGSVQAYIAALQQYLRRADEASAAAKGTNGAAAEEKTTTMNTAATTSSTSSAMSTPKRVEQISSSATRSADSLMRVTALLKEAQRLVERGPDVNKSTPLPGQLAHEAKTFAALD
jgi:hypothetical protein